MGKGRSRGRGGQNDRGEENVDDGNISWNDIKMVQDLIERCMQHYMSLAEIISAAQVFYFFSFPLPCRVYHRFRSSMLFRFTFSISPSHIFFESGTCSN